MAGNDFFQLQCVAHATVSAANPAVATLQGVTLVFTHNTSYVFTYDPGAELAVPAANVRILTQVGTVDSFTVVVKTSSTVTTVNAFSVSAQAAKDAAFDIVWFKSPTP